MRTDGFVELVKTPNPGVRGEAFYISDRLVKFLVYFLWPKETNMSSAVCRGPVETGFKKLQFWPLQRRVEKMVFPTSVLAP